MESFLNETDRIELRRRQRAFTDKRVYVRVTVLLLLDRGRSAQEVAEDLGLDASTVYRYRSAYHADGLETYLQTDYQGRWGKLSCRQLSALRAALNARLYTDSAQVADWIESAFGVRYTSSGVVALLHRIGYRYKKTRPVPCEADFERQKAFLEKELEPLLEQARAGESVVYFVDGVHPTHNSRAAYAWIEAGQERLQPTVSGRERVNLNGALNALDVTDVHVLDADSVNAQSTQELYESLLARHPDRRVVVVSDNARYYRNARLKAWVAGQERLEQVFLPPYSPNLNLIERLWKFMRKQVIDTSFFRRKGEFRQALLQFFKNIGKYEEKLKSLLTLKFQLIDSHS